MASQNTIGRVCAGCMGPRLRCCTNCCAVVVALLAIGIGLLVAIIPTPTFPGLPSEYHPHRPLPIVLLNALGGLFGDRLLSLPTEEAAIRSACKAAKLPADATCTVDVPGEDTEWREGLRRLLRSYEEDANLTALGKVIATGQTETWLKARVRLIHAWSRLPDGSLAAQSVDRPILIVGLPRTGTTFLLNLLKQDPALRTPLHWELVEPIPGEGEPPLGDAHVGKIQGLLDQYMQLLPGIEKWHPMSATMAEECVVTLAHAFSSMLFEATFDVSSYNRWLVGLDAHAHAHAFRWHRMLLQFLQDREGIAHAVPGRRWVLKTPWFSHGPVLEAALAEYPNALVIQTHRDPSVVVGSSASIHVRTYGAGSDMVDAATIGASQLSLMETLVESNQATRRRWRAEKPWLSRRIADVQLAELKRDPLAAVAKVYKQLGLELKDEVKSAMQAWLATKQVDHGKHKFELADFGLSAKSVAERPVFRRYCEEYRLDC